MYGFGSVAVKPICTVSEAGSFLSVDAKNFESQMNPISLVFIRCLEAGPIPLFKPLLFYLWRVSVILAGID